MTWMTECYSRTLVDNHIADVDPTAMSKFLPQEYARMMALAGAESSMVYACDHNGNCYYPTKVGHQHAGLHGRDIFGETVQELHRRSIVPIAYTTITFHNDSVRRFPHSAQRDIQGNTPKGRYLIACPNCQDTKEFYRQQISEIVQYPVAGLFIDMTFWDMLCCCDNCRRRFREHYGAELPEVIDWRDPLWRTYVKFREESCVELAKELTEQVRRLRPDITVVHQFAGIMSLLSRGQCGQMQDYCEYATGDFYCGVEQHRFGCKMFDAYTHHHPYEYMTSRCVNLYDHTSTKSDPELFLHALTTLANTGAYFFIDAINPDGTLEEPFYRRLGDINARLKPFRQAIRSRQPRLTAQTALYFSPALEASHDIDGMPMAEWHEEAIMSSTQVDGPRETTHIGKLLNALHVPWKVVTETSRNLQDFQTVIVAGAVNLREEEVTRLREFVRQGGTLLATGKTSLLDKNFELADLFGVDYTGKDTDLACYNQLPDGRLVFAKCHAPLVAPRPDTKVLATLNVPKFPYNDPLRYASIHSNPPGMPLDAPAWTEHAFGKGRCVWLATNVLGVPQASQEEFAREVLRSVLPISPIVNAEEIPQAVEITLLRGSQGELIVTAVNFQQELPPIHIHDFKIRLRLPEGFAPTAVLKVSDGTISAPALQNGILTLALDDLAYGEFWIVK